MSVVYDWARSSTPDIVSFTLSDPFGTILKPDRDVIDRCTIVTVSTPNMPEMTSQMKKTNSLDSEIQVIALT